MFSLLLLLISSCLLALDSRCVWSCSEHTVSLFLFAKLLKNVHVRLLPVSGSTPPLRTVKYSPLRVYSPYIPTDMTEVWKLPRARRVWYARAAEEWPSHQERERERRGDRCRHRVAKGGTAGDQLAHFMWEWTSYFTSLSHIIRRYFTFAVVKSLHCRTWMLLKSGFLRSWCDERRLTCFHTRREGAFLRVFFFDRVARGGEGGKNENI